MEIQDITLDVLENGTYRLTAYAGKYGMCDKDGYTINTDYCDAQDFIRILLELIEWQRSCKMFFSWGFYNFDTSVQIWGLPY